MAESIARGSQTEIVYIKETTAGSVPTSGNVYKIKAASESFESQLPTDFDGDIASDGMKASTVRQLRTLTGGFSSQVEKGAYNDFFLSVLRQSALTTDTYSVTVTSTDNGDGTCTIAAGSGTPFADVIVNGPIKVAGFSASAMNDIFRVVEVLSSGLSVKIGKISDSQSFAAESTVSATLTQTYAKNGGSFPTNFTIEKRMSQVNTEGSFIRLSGEQVNTMSLDVAPGGAPGLSFEFLGLNNTFANDGVVGPYNWVVDGAQTAPDTTIAITGGTTDPQAGDILHIAGDATNTRYTVSSFAAGVVTIEPTLQDDIADADKVFFYRPGADAGSGQKMENNLGYMTLDGDQHCITSGNLSLTSNLSPTNCVGDDEATNLVEGSRDVTGTVTPYFCKSIQPILVSIRAGSTFPIVFFLRDVSGNVIAFHVPQAKADQELVKRADDGALMQNIPFKSEKNTALGTNCIIHVLNA